LVCSDIIISHLIGIFHAFAHQYECQVLFSPRNIVGIGLTDGEGCERIWALARHIIASLRGSTPYRRRQLLTNLMLEIGDRKHFGLASAFLVFFRTTLKMIRECKRELKDYQAGTGVNMKELQQQAKLMQEYFENPEEQGNDIQDNICETIMAILVMNEFDEVHSNLSHSAQTSFSYLDMRLLITWRTGGRIERSLDIDQDTLHTRLNQLLRKANQSKSLWLNEDGSPTDHYHAVMDQLPLSDLRLLMNRIWAQLACRKMEYRLLKASSLVGINPILCHSLHLGTTAAGNIEGDIAKRSQNVVKLIKEYNKKLDSLPPNDNNPQPLPEKIAKDLALGDSQLWELVRFGCNEKWAKEPKMRRAISVLQTWIRAEEELVIIAEECQRFVKSHCQQLDNVERAFLSELRSSSLHEILVEIGAKSEQALRSVTSEAMGKMVRSLMATRGAKNENFHALQGI
jgi:Kyakuja-Dileera-Zisupton transposase